MSNSETCTQGCDLQEASKTPTIHGSKIAGLRAPMAKKPDITEGKETR